MVQAIYDTESVALLVRWHDMRADTQGKNGLSLQVPPEEEEDAAPAGAEANAGDPFAEDAAAAGAPPSEFSDAVAVQIPAQATTDSRKPYFIFGDGQSPVDLWYFDLARKEPRQFTGKGSADISANDAAEVTGTASYDKGEWSVIFKRPLASAAGASFKPGGFMPVAFSVWDGFNRERGNRRGLTVWYSLFVEPETSQQSSAGPIVRMVLLVLAIELVVIGLVRWRHNSRSRGKLGDTPSQTAATSV
jgi:hypothetical protein